MRLWRLSRHASLDGTGGIRVSGRWHTAGRAIVYCAPNPATAVLEQLVHQEIRRPEALEGYRMLELDVPDTLETERIDVSGLPADWSARPDLTRKAVDDWLIAERSALLLVPSAVVPATDNALINPKHADAAHVRLLNDAAFSFDPRLLSAGTSS